MSADFYRTCPNCLAEAHNQLNIVLDSYGKVAEAQYSEEKIRAKRRLDHVGETLEEKFYGRMSMDGRLQIMYSCSCKVCGFHKEYSHEEQVL